MQVIVKIASGRGQKPQDGKGVRACYNEGVTKAMKGLYSVIEVGEYGARVIGDFYETQEEAQGTYPGAVMCWEEDCGEEEEND